MRIDPIEIAFTTVAGGGTLATIDMRSYDVFSLGVDVTSIAGAPTNFTVTAYPLETDDTTPINDGNGLNTGARTTAGQYLLDQWGATGAQVSPVVENTFKKWIVVVTFTGGTTPTITGKVLAFMKHMRQG